MNMEVPNKTVQRTAEILRLPVPRFGRQPLTLGVICIKSLEMKNSSVSYIIQYPQ